MIGKAIVFVAVAVSCSTALPFGSCGNWDTPAFGNFVGGPGNVITSGLNLPGSTSVVEGPAFPGNNILGSTSNIIPNNIITQAIPNGLSPFPAPSVSGPIVGGIQRFVGPISFPNIPLQGQLVSTSPNVPMQIQNIETRVPNVQTRFPAMPARFPNIDGVLPGFPSIQGTGVFQGSNSQFPC